MSSPQNKKCRPRKVFGVKPPSNPATYPDARLSQHYIGPEMIFSAEICKITNVISGLIHS